MYVQYNIIDIISLIHITCIGGLIFKNSSGPTLKYSSLFKNITCFGEENSLDECRVHEGDCLTRCPSGIRLKCFSKLKIHCRLGNM